MKFLLPAVSMTLLAACSSGRGVHSTLAPASAAPLPSQFGGIVDITAAPVETETHTPHATIAATLTPTIPAYLWAACDTRAGVLTTSDGVLAAVPCSNGLSVDIAIVRTSSAQVERELSYVQLFSQPFGASREGSLHPLAWSQGNRYLYFTAIPQMDSGAPILPDGVSLFRVDLARNAVSLIIPPSKKPFTLYSFAISRDARLLASIPQDIPPTIYISDLTSGGGTVFRLDDLRGFAGKGLWSPDSSALALVLSAPSDTHLALNEVLIFRPACGCVTASTKPMETLPIPIRWDKGIVIASTTWDNSVCIAIDVTSGAISPADCLQN